MKSLCSSAQETFESTTDSAEADSKNVRADHRIGNHVRDAGQIEFLAYSSERRRSEPDIHECDGVVAAGAVICITGAVMCIANTAHNCDGPCKFMH